MAKLNGLAAWLSGGSAFSLNKSAQGVMSAGLVSMAAGSCGSSCGAGDKDKGKKEPPKPGACASSCGAGDDDKGEKKPKPSACGSSCGAGDKK